MLVRLPFGPWLHRWIQRGFAISEIEISLGRGGAGLDGLRVAYLSDLHAGSFMREAELCAIFDQVAALEPDMVCLGGDLINTFEREILMYRAALARIHPPLGVFAVPGNHDHFYGRDISLWETFLRSRGVAVLINSGVRVQHGDDTLWVAGVDDLTEGEPDLPAALRGHHEGEPVLLLSHHPDFFWEAAAAGVDLTLSGHTHGGQVLVFGKTPLDHTRFGYWRGHFEESGAQLYVSRGVGVTFLPLRIGATPEIPVLRLSVATASSMVAEVPQSIECAGAAQRDEQNCS